VTATESGPPSEGVLLVDKPPGITSHDAVAMVRRALRTRKVGHAGTLDPMATGLLLIGAGRATRLLRFLGDLPKTYEATMRLGVETTTLDADGEVVRRTTVEVSDADVQRAMTTLVGDSMQTPPAFSAVKVGGRRLYEAARAGEELRADPRLIHVDAFDLLSRRGPDADVRVVCGSGTYVRVLAADVGTALGCGAHLVGLRRTAIGHFRVIDAARPEDPGELLPVEAAVGHLPRVALHGEEIAAARNGRILGPAGHSGPYGVYGDHMLIGVYQDDGTKAMPLVVLAPAQATASGGGHGGRGPSFG
jgi:tRNA pseudouridine55 synthase